VKKVLLIVIPILVVVGIILFLKFGRGSRGKESIPSVKVERGDIVEKALAVGKIEPRHKIAVKSKTSGIVEKIYVDVGDRVKKGDLLMDIKPEPTPLEIAEAKRNLELAALTLDLARKELERDKSLKKDGLISQESYDQVEKIYREAELRYQLAAEKLSLLEHGRIRIGGKDIETVVRAPVDGHVLERLVDVGDPVVPLTSYQPGTELMKIADMRDLVFRGTVDEIDVGKLREGMPAEIRVGPLPDKRIPGKLARISPQSRKVENAIVFDVEIEITSSERESLRSGYSATADIILKEKKDVLLIPERVLEFRNDSTFVKVPNPEGEEPLEVAIETGLSDGINIEVVSGLKEGDEVLEKPPKEIK